MNSISGLARGATRKPLTAKQGNKNYYKGNRSGLMGRWTNRGNFIVEEHRKRQFVIPSLDACEVLNINQFTPYVTSKADKLIRGDHTVRDYFKEQNKSDLLTAEENQEAQEIAKGIWKSMNTRGVVRYQKPTVYTNASKYAIHYKNK